LTGQQIHSQYHTKYMKCNFYYACDNKIKLFPLQSKTFLSFFWIITGDLLVQLAQQT